MNHIDQFSVLFTDTKISQWNIHISFLKHYHSAKYTGCL